MATEIHPITIRILVQVDDNEPAEIASADIPFTMHTISVASQEHRDGSRLVVKADPIDSKAVLLKALRKSLKTAQRGL